MQKKVQYNKDMQSRISRKLVAVIIGNGMRNQLHPLTMNFPISNLPIGNKKLIVYQLQQLEQISEAGTIIIIYSQQSIKLKQFLETEFIPNHPTYPHKLQFFRVDNNLSEYCTLQKLLQSTEYNGFQQTKGVIVVPRDLVSSIKFKSLVQDFCQGGSDIGLLLKQKKEYGKDEKKPDVDFQANLDIVMIGQSGEVYTLRSVQNYQYCGFSLPASIYQKANHATFQRVVDTRLYLFGPRIIKIIKNLQSAELCHLKSDFLDTVIRNQNNTTLLSHIEQQCKKPIKIYAKVAGQNEYIRCISNIGIYESVNLDSLIRGPKQKDILIPNKYTQQIDEQLMSDFKGSLIGKGCEIEAGIRLTRSVVENGCKIGKGVDISNSIIMFGSVIEDGCKIMNSIVGPACLVKSQSVLAYCQLAMNCVVEKGSNIQKQMVIPLQ